jgi:hypothetical protein
VNRTPLRISKNNPRRRFSFVAHATVMTTSTEENPGPGRPHRLAQRPSKQRQKQIDLARIAEEAQVRVDPVHAAVKSRNTRAFLEEAALAAATEAANVKWERQQRPLDREAPKMASRRVALLVDVARFTVLLARPEPGRPPPAAIAKIFRAFWSTVRETAGGVLSAAEVDRLMARCATEVESGDLEEFEA